MADSFLFYDLETFGQDPRRTRISQYAAIRTDADLNEIDTPVSFFVRPADDLLPSPMATLVTGITPQQALAEGISEAEAFDRINEQLSRPGTCALGYNTLRFDDEFVRYGLFRNFHDPYEREWRNGNSRWDLLDMLRLMRAMRPDGIQWPLREDGATSFKLEHLAEANNVREGDAHEALSDVRATIGMARLFKQSQPRLWDYALKLRDKRFVGGLLDVAAMKPVLHISMRYPASRLCAAPVLPLAVHPTINNRVIVFDLEGDRRPAGTAGRGDRTAPVHARQRAARRRGAGAAEGSAPEQGAGADRLEPPARRRPRAPRPGRGRDRGQGGTPARVRPAAGREGPPGLQPAPRRHRGRRRCLAVRRLPRQRRQAAACPGAHHRAGAAGRAGRPLPRPAPAGAAVPLPRAQPSRQPRAG
jgi:hypothetical protein